MYAGKVVEAGSVEACASVHLRTLGRHPTSRA
jgi:hypothetical protein